MGFRPAVTEAFRRALPAAALLTLLALAAGCSGAPSGNTGAGEAKPAAVEPPADAKEPAAPRSEARRAGAPAATRGGANLVRVRDTGCIAFEPHWTSLAVGQSLTWRSELDRPVTIHVSAGTFDRTTYVVKPGGSVTTGPARSAGSFTIWTEPAACQGPPRGVKGSGPGLTVETAAH